MKTQITVTTDQLKQILKNTGLGKEEFLRRMTRVKTDNYMKNKSKLNA